MVAMKRIESRNNPTIKSLVLLKDKRNREEQKLFFFEGVHLLEEYLRAGLTPRALFVREDAAVKYEQLIAKAGCEVYELTEQVYEKITEEKAPQGIFTLSDYLPHIVKAGRDISYDEFASRIQGVSVMLSDLQDNGNVGTVVRTAAALDCDVILAGSCADVYSSKTLRATMGAIFFNPLYICPDGIAAVEALQGQGKRVIATALTENARQLGRFDLKPDDCFVIGNEGKGLKAEFIERCSFTAIIPMSGKTESFNAANAAAIIMWEAKREADL